MKPILAYVLLAFALSTPAQAQTQVSPQITPEQMQNAMLQQTQMMSVMFDLRRSKLGFEETVAVIKSAAEKRGWKVGGVQDMQAQLREAGAKEAKKMKIVHLCPVGANEKVAKAAGGKAPPLPCRATVFDGKDGKIYVMRMDLNNLAKTLQGDLAKAMAEVGAEEAALYKSILD